MAHIRQLSGACVVVLLKLQVYIYVNPLIPTVAMWVKHHVPDLVKPSFVIFDIRALDAQP